MLYNKLTTDTPFEFEAGGSVPSIDIVYHTSREEYHEGDRVVWVCHALTANSDVEDWWPQLCGPGKFIDTDKDFVVCVNILGSAYGTSGPSSIDPTTGEPYYLNFPKITIRDIVKTFTIVRNKLGIKKIDFLLGSSIGGFQAIEWAITEPDIFEKAAFIATAPRVSPWLSAQAEAQRMALEADQTFRDAKSLEGGSKGLMCARAQALITYRSYDGYRLTQSEADPDTLFAGRAASYERHQGNKIVARHFDAYSYWYLCYELDSHNVGRGRGGVEKALASIKAKTKVLTIDSDGIFPPSEGKQWAAMIPDCEYYELSSDFGHDGFLLETETLKKILN